MKNNNFNYQSGWGNHFSSEAITGVLPIGQNSPQRVARGLYAEQLSGNAFTAPKSVSVRSWLYRIRPSVTHQEFKPYKHPHFTQKKSFTEPFNPTQMRWSPMPSPKKSLDFIDSLYWFARNGKPTRQYGCNILLYAANRSMENCYFYNADGDLLIVLQHGDLVFHTEFGKIRATPKEIVVIPRGVKFSVSIVDGEARGYICENFLGHFMLPERGPIGANGLANERDFLYPVADYEDQTGEFSLVCKFNNLLWSAKLDHSPLDVVAWHGNYVPYKYDLIRFNTMGSVSYDHPDPSIFTVLTAASNTPGVANIDLVIFPERHLVATHTFRPPYYHRNIMNEFMGLIYGVYDAKNKGFSPGGASIHNCMSAHGPDSAAYQKAVSEELKPVYYQGNLAFMFESRYPWQASDHALTAKFKQHDYLECWEGLDSDLGGIS